MPQDFLFDFTFGGEEFEHVVLTWGLDRHRPWSRRVQVDDQDWDRRSWIPDPAERERGVGWSVDVPVVLGMLDQVRAGRATVDEARDMLLALTQEPSKVSGCCVACDDAVDEYAEAIARCNRARARFDDARTYSYLVSQSAIHQWDCRHFTGRLPEGAGSSLGKYVRPGGPERDLKRLTRRGGGRLDRCAHRAEGRSAGASVPKLPACPARGVGVGEQRRSPRRWLTP